MIKYPCVTSIYSSFSLPVIAMPNRTSLFPTIISKNQPMRGIAGEVAGKKRDVAREDVHKRNFRRKQAAPRSRLVRQCDECDFSSSIINEFKTHMKFEHGHGQLFLCEICRFHTSSSLDYQLHLNSHQ